MARSRSPRSGSTKFSVLLRVPPPARPVAQALLRTQGFRDPVRVFGAIGHLHSNPQQRRSLAKIFPHLMRTCVRSGDPDRAVVNFARLVAALPHPNMFYRYLAAAPDRLELLVRVFAHSQALADTLMRDAHYFHFLIAPEMLAQPRAKSWLAAELQRLLLPVRPPERQYDVVRRFRRRETLRIGARDLLGRATVEETTLELSNLADVCLQAVFTIALATLRARLKLTVRAEASMSRLAIIGLGKLGGQELNYSSDVDVMFVYDEEGDVTPQLSYHQFYTKLAEEITRAVGAPSEEGNIFRIDLRLRPEGASGPLARSLESCENYYAQWGETWERMALVKARPVAGAADVGAAFLQMVQPFVYSRHAPPGVIQQMGVLKDRIEKEVVGAAELTRHVKLGIGGIREIEFIVQSFQVLRGGWAPLLRERNTLRALAAAAQAAMLTTAEARALAAAYRFLRQVEHRLQMEMELQTHTIPDEARALYRLARSLGFAAVDKFLAAEQAQCAVVRRIYQSVLAGATEQAGGATASPLAAEHLPQALAQAGLVDVPAAQKTVENLLHGPGFVHVSPRTKELFGRIFPGLLLWAGRVADPDAALARFARFVTAYGSRALLYEILAGNPKLVEMLVRVGDASRFLSETLAQQPDLFDEICRGATLHEPKNLERMCEEAAAVVRAERPATGRNAPERLAAAMAAARTWKNAELLRIGIEDVLGLVDLERVQQEISGLAEASLRLALAQVRQDQRLVRLPFAVIGLGKFGGQELAYGADLDVVFVGGRDDSDQEAAIKLASGVMAFLDRQTPAGTMFRVDPRLRPDGEKGPLAGSLVAHRDYYRKRAQLWERQALTKARFVAGDVTLGRQFTAMAQDIGYAQPLTPAEAAEIIKMRHRIETERGDQQQVELEFKTGPGGLIDVEFLIQALQLRHGTRQPPVRTTHSLAALNRLTALGAVDDEQSYHLRRGYLFLRKIESTLRRVDNTSISRIPAAEREQTILAKRLGFATVADFLRAYRLTLRTLRDLFQQVMGALAANAD